MNALKSILKKVSAFHRRAGFGTGDFFALLAFAFVCASIGTALLGDFTSLTYVRQLSSLLFWSVLVCAAVLLWAAFLITSAVRVIRWGLLLASLMYALILVSTLPGSIWFNVGVVAVLLLVIKYVAGEDRLGISGLPVTWKTSLGITAVLFFLFIFAVSFCTVSKYRAFQQGTFDFGIFCQMFEQMAKTGLPYTTVERSEYLSHFAVHFSPAFYLLLPGYLIFRSPVYLLCAQAVMVGLGMFPIRRICRTLGFSPMGALGACALYALYPTMANGCFYDFHENKFLSLFLLYLIAFVLEKKRAPAAVFALLVLSVKEDAFIYVAAVALWMLLSGRDRPFAAILLAASLVWFVFACAMIRVSGGEIMSDRFSNYSTSGGGLVQAIRTCFYDIGYLIREVFAGADTEAFSEMTYEGQKLEFVLWTCIPLLFMPFAGKKSVQLVLLIPLLVVNLMPNWMYQFDINYQYTYGTAALLIASALLTVSGMSAGGRRFFFVAAISVSMVFTVSVTVPKAQRSVTRYYSNQEAYDATARALAEIPEDASVTAYGYMMPHLYFVDDLHTCPDYYAPLEKTEYYVIDTRYDYDRHTEKMFAAMGDDYTLITEAGYAKIYQRTQSVQNGN